VEIEDERRQEMTAAAVVTASMIRIYGIFLSSIK
jgi:hypothetical protein